MTTAKELSKQLRLGEDRFLGKRRGIVACGLAAAGAMGLITLYQIGLIKHLPEPPIPGFDADKVDASDEAYAHLKMPDAFIGLGKLRRDHGPGDVGRPRSRPHPALDPARQNRRRRRASLTVDQWTKHKAFCFWCLLAAGATFATLPLAGLEAGATARLSLPSRF